MRIIQYIEFYRLNIYNFLIYFLSKRDAHYTKARLIHYVRVIITYHKVYEDLSSGIFFNTSFLRTFEKEHFFLQILQMFA